MQDRNYKLRYLPLFYEDLKEKVEYIAFEKQNPDAALRLVIQYHILYFKRVALQQFHGNIRELFFEYRQLP